MAKKISVKKAKKQINKKTMKQLSKKASVKKVGGKKAGGKKAQKQTSKKAVAKKGLLGVVTHYYGGIEVGILKLVKPLRVGDKVHIKGATTDFTQVVDSMQFDHKDISSGKKGQEIGTKVADKVREGDEVYEAAE